MDFSPMPLFLSEFKKKLTINNREWGGRGGIEEGDGGENSLSGRCESGADPESGIWRVQGEATEV